MPKKYSSEQRQDPTFQILIPPAGGLRSAFPVSGSNYVCVRILNQDFHNTGFSGAISSFGSTNYGPWANLIQEGSPNQNNYYAAVNAGSVPGSGSIQKTATVVSFKSTGMSGSNVNSFWAYSGASQNCSGLTSSRNHQPIEPDPVVLCLRLDTPVVADCDAASELLNQPTLLIHSQDRNFAGCWFSRSIDLSAQSGNPAFWMLQKTAAGAWNLILRRVSGDLATYHFKGPKKAGPFPIKLKLKQKGVGGKRFKKWPKSVTVILA